MTPIVGAVYVWNEQFTGSSWKKYFLTLNDKTGRLLWVNKTGKMKGGVDLKSVFLSIYCRRLNPDDYRLKKTRLKFAPFDLIIPMIKSGFF